MRSLAYITIVGLLAAILYLNIKQSDLFLGEKDSMQVQEQSESFNKEQVEEIVADYIENNPEAIIESLTDYQQNKEKRDREKAKENLSEKADEIFNNPNDPVAGNKEGDVTLVEFFDYSCGYCKKATPHVSRLKKEDPSLKIIFKELPILGQKSVIAAKTAIAVNNIAPEKYLDYHLKLMSSRVTDKESAIKLAVELGVDGEKLSEEFDSELVQDIINDNRRLSRALAITGTPAFIVGDELLPGYAEYSKLKAAVTRQRNKKD